MHKLVVFGTAALGAAFVVLLGMQLPESVVSHFSASGQPDASMPRTPFVALMAVLAAALPPCVWWLQVRQAEAGSVKIPFASFWLAPERKAATVHWLSAHAAVFSISTTVFFCWVFWLVYAANSSARPSLHLAGFFGALLVYLLCTLAWVGALHLRFNRARGV